jgi:hypothetical protein
MKLTYTRLYTGKDQHSYFSDEEIEIDQETPIGFLSKDIPASSLQFRWTSGSRKPFSNTLRRI